LWYAVLNELTWIGWIFLKYSILIFEKFTHSLKNSLFGHLYIAEKLLYFSRSLAWLFNYKVCCWEVTSTFGRLFHNRRLQESKWRSQAPQKTRAIWIVSSALFILSAIVGTRGRALCIEGVFGSCQIWRQNFQFLSDLLLNRKILAFEFWSECFLLLTVR
jgi:hypothetical protein